MRETMFKFVVRAVLLLTIVFGLLITLPLVLPKEGRSDVVIASLTSEEKSEVLVMDLDSHIYMLDPYMREGIHNRVVFKDTPNIFIARFDRANFKPGLYLLNVITGEQFPLFAEDNASETVFSYNPIFSNDRNQVVFYEVNSRTVYVFDLKTRAKHDVFRLHEGALTPNFAWSPDDQTIAILSGDQLFLSKPDKRSIRKHVVKSTGLPVWSPDGKHIMIESNNLSNENVLLQILDVETGNENRYTRNLYAARALFSCDKLVYRSTLKSEANIGVTGHVYTVNLFTGETTRINTQVEQAIGSFFPLANCQEIAFQASESKSPTLYIYNINENSSREIAEAVYVVEYVQNNTLIFIKTDTNSQFYYKFEVGIDQKPVLLHTLNPYSTTRITWTTDLTRSVYWHEDRLYVWEQDGIYPLSPQGKIVHSFNLFSLEDFTGAW
jgi:hypothetical protein